MVEAAENAENIILKAGLKLNTWYEVESRSNLPTYKYIDQRTERDQFPVTTVHYDITGANSSNTLSMYAQTVVFTFTSPKEVADPELLATLNNLL